MTIALFLPNWVGDAVMATPAVAALRRHFAEVRCVGVMRPYVAGVVEGTDWFDELVFCGSGPGSRGVLGAAARLRRQEVDLAVLFPNSFRSALVARLGGCRRIVGYARAGRGLLLTDRLAPLVGPDGRFLPSPVIDAYNRLAEHVGCPPPGYRMLLATTPADEAAADAVWERHRLGGGAAVVALNPGAAFGAAKHWPCESFARLARRLVEEHAARVLVLCGPGERELARSIVRQAGRSEVASLAEEQLSLGLTKACVRRCDLLVTTDSGPRHFAAAFDRPVVTLFGPTHVAWTETYHPKAVHLQKPVPCGPCQLRVCPLDHRCMTGLTPDEVFAAATDLLGRFARPAARAAHERRAS
jgi:heptosyltransferase-2